jgi:hypothetical protein
MDRACCYEGDWRSRPTRPEKFLSITVTRLALALAWAPGGLAAPPANDDFDNATVIGSLPYADALDTTEATYTTPPPDSAAGRAPSGTHSRLPTPCDSLRTCFLLRSSPVARIHRKSRLKQAPRAFSSSGTTTAWRPARFLARRCASDHPLAGTWRALATANFRIGANGSSVAYFVNPRAGFAYRVRNVFIRDADHLSGASAWKYFR